MLNEICLWRSIITAIEPLLFNLSGFNAGR